MTEPPRVTLPGGREASVVSADDAGQYYVIVDCRDILDVLRVRGMLTRRQAEALSHLARLRRASGLRPAWQRDGAGRGERPEDTERKALAELRDLLAVMGEPVGTQVMHMLATDEWQISARVSEVQDAADRVADRLRLPR